jgi:hypothetical protein
MSTILPVTLPLRSEWAAAHAHGARRRAWIVCRSCGVTSTVAALMVSPALGQPIASDLNSSITIGTTALAFDDSNPLQLERIVGQASRTSLTGLKNALGETWASGVLSLDLGLAALVTASLPQVQPEDASQPAGAESPAAPSDEAAEDQGPKEPTTNELFFSPDDGAFDVSGFLSTRTGFLPLAMPISEPAVGYGLAIGLSYFHSEPTEVPDPSGSGPSRFIMPSTTVLMGAATENGTWAGGLAHLGVWDKGRIRYVGAVGYASLDLDWFGKGESLGGQSIAYTNDVFFLVQNIRFKLGSSDFYMGPLYRYFDTDAEFGSSTLNSGIPDIELQSRTSGIGVQASYDSLDHPFQPRQGWRADGTVSQQAEWLGGDFDYTKITTFAIAYLPLAENTVLGLKLNGDFVAGDAPFYDLPTIMMRGLARGRYVDDGAVYAETELRYDFAKRWSAIGFAGVGKVGSTFDEFSDSDAHAAGGFGVRYLIADRYGLRLGADLAYGDDEVTLYISVGTGWIRP